MNGLPKLITFCLHIHKSHIFIDWREFPVCFILCCCSIFSFSPELKPCYFIRCSSKLSALLVPYSHRWHLKVPGSFIVIFWVLMSWISYHYEFLIPCHVPIQSHIIYKKKFIHFMLLVDKIFHIISRSGLKFTIITIYLMITHKPSSCPGSHIFNHIYHNSKFVDE